MATSLRRRPLAAVAAIADDDPTTNDDEPMDTEWTGPVPNRYFFFEIEFAMDALGALQFSYLNPLPAAALPPGGILQVIAEVMNQPVVPLPTGFSFARAADAEETPLDIKVREPAFIILRLRIPRNMEFDPERAAISHKDADHKQYYGGLKHVGANGIPTGAPAANCKLIYFIADPPDPPEYDHGFNINVRLVQRPRGPVPRSLKFRIDPDVRYPGGGVGDP